MKMKKHKLQFTFLVCLAGASLLRGQVVGTSRVIRPVVQDITPEVRLIKFSPDVAVEQLRGSTALNHLRSVMARRPEAFQKAVEEMQAKGFKATQEVFVERTLDTRLLKGKKSVTSPYSLIQTSGESNSQGEIVFWSTTDQAMTG